MPARMHGRVCGCIEFRFVRSFLATPNSCPVLPVQIHKLMAGLLDQHTLAATPDALGMVEGMARYFCARSRRVVRTRGLDHWHAVLENEFGGMNEVRGTRHRLPDLAGRGGEGKGEGKEKGDGSSTFLHTLDEDAHAATGVHLTATCMPQPCGPISSMNLSRCCTICTW